MSTQITPTSFTEVIALWLKPRALAAEINQKPGTVRQWKGRDSIDPVHYPAIVQAAIRKGRPDITQQLLEDLYKARWPDQIDAPAQAVDASEYA